MINLTVFSKDRPAQLDLLLKSIKMFSQELISHGIRVLYKYSDPRINEGYEKVKKYHPDIQYVLEQRSFKEHVCALTDASKPYTMFFVDDQVFKAPFSLNSLEFKEFSSNDQVLCLSLRLYPGINYSYTNNSPSPPPHFIKDNPLTWIWTNSHIGNEFSYPMSVDSHLFRTKDLCPYIFNMGYNGPNTFEGYMAANPLRSREYMICFPESRTVNIPVNKVQIENNNRRGNISITFLNDNFLSGKRLSVNNIIGYRNIAPHEEIPLIFE
jgi:hypothetical protein